MAWVKAPLVLDGGGGARDVHRVEGGAKHGHIGPDAPGQAGRDLGELMEGQAAALKVVAVEQTGAAAVGNHHDMVPLGGGLHPLEKMLAFLRSVSNFFDTLAGPTAKRRGA